MFRLPDYRLRDSLRTFPSPPVARVMRKPKKLFYADIDGIPE